MSEDEVRPDPEEIFATCLRIKGEGNAFFEANKLPEASARYTEGVRLCTPGALKAHPPLAALAAVLLTNRAAVMLQLRQFVAAAGSAQQAETLDATNWKAAWRQGLALMAQKPRIERSEMAVEAFKRALANPNMPEEQKDDAREALYRAQARLRDGRDAVPLPESCVIC